MKRFSDEGCRPNALRLSIRKQLRLHAALPVALAVPPGHAQTHACKDGHAQRHILHEYMGLHIHP